MDIVLKQKSDQPIYLQIYEQISFDILSGKLEADSILPSIRTLALELNVSVITVRSAFDLLVEKGFVYTLAGKGCFVQKLHKHQSENKQMELAKARLIKELPYYKGLGLSVDELKSLIDDYYDKI